jgi:hypothetical protein
MQKFDYSTVVFPTTRLFVGAKLDHEAFQAHLNGFGEEGWELVNVFTISRVEGTTSEVVAVFKRPLP